MADLVKESFFKDCPVKVINNGIDLTIFKPTESDFREKYDLKDKYIVLGVAFKWQYYKGLDVMKELSKINEEGTTIMLVTHDVKVAARCSRVLYIVDGNIKGEYNLGKETQASELRERERKLNGWLMEMGW
jgi:glycosyltransferase involved in cell wall biosynthesis